LFQLRVTAVYNVVQKKIFLNPHKSVSQKKVKIKLVQDVSQKHGIAVVH